MTMEVPKSDAENASRFMAGQTYDWPVPGKQLVPGKILENDKTHEKFTAHPFTITVIDQLCQELPSGTVVLLQDGGNGGWFNGISVKKLEEEFSSTAQEYRSKMSIVVPRG